MIIKSKVGRAVTGEVQLGKEVAFMFTTCGCANFNVLSESKYLPTIIGLRRGSVNTGTWEPHYAHAKYG